MQVLSSFFAQSLPPFIRDLRQSGGKLNYLHYAEKFAIVINRNRHIVSMQLPKRVFIVC